MDISNNTLVHEFYIERNGETISRAVTEIVGLSDGTYIVQSFNKSPLYDERLEDKGDAYFMIFDRNKLEVIKAKFAPDVNYAYNSIVGKGKTTVEDMAQGYTLVRKMTVANGVASVEKYQ